MVLSVLMVLGAAVVAAAELVFLNQQRRWFLGQDQPRGRFLARQQRAAARQLYLRVRRILSELWITARTAPFTGEPIAGVAAREVAADPSELIEARLPPGSAPDGDPPPSNRGRKLKRHAARNVLHWIRIAEEEQLQSHRSVADTAAALRAAALPSAETLATPARADTVWGTGSSRAAAGSPPTPVGEGIVYVDAGGRVTFANAAARALLHWDSGDRALSEVLAGGPQESAALLEAVARHELIEREVTLLGGPSPTRLEISALALRDRDGNLWGAALFIRRSPGARQPSTVESR